MGAGRAPAAASEDVGRRRGRRRARGPAAADVERRRRDLALPADGRDGLLLPQRRGRRGDLRPRRLRARSSRSSAASRTSPATTSSFLAARRTASPPTTARAALPRLRVTGADRDPAPVPQRVRAAARACAVLPPRHPSADRARHASRARRVPRASVRVRGGYQTYVLDYHPFDVVGWDGYVYPWTFSIHDFEPITGRIHMPPPSHQTFQGRNFVICSFCPRKLDFDPLAIPIPYHHSNLNSEEMIYYVDGNFASRKAIEIGSVTLHPSAIPHGPAPGLAEKSIGMTETHELAVMCDTFHPLRLTKLAKDLDDGKYWHSWFEDPAPVGHRRRGSRGRHEPFLSWTRAARCSRGCGTTPACSRRPSCRSRRRWRSGIGSARPTTRGSSTASSSGRERTSMSSRSQSSTARRSGRATSSIAKGRRSSVAVARAFRPRRDRGHSSAAAVTTGMRFKATAGLAPRVADGRRARLPEPARGVRLRRRGGDAQDA